MKLYGSPISPFSRKAMVIARELDLKLEILPRPDNAAEFRRINPLGKIPALVLDDGSALFDSPVICEYLNELGGGKFFPGNSLWRNNSGKWKALTLQALGDGLGGPIDDQAGGAFDARDVVVTEGLLLRSPLPEGIA